mgnify:CR=1 FL=1
MMRVIKNNPNWHIKTVLCGLEDDKELGEHYRVSRYHNGQEQIYGRYQTYEEAKANLNFLSFTYKQSSPG